MITASDVTRAEQTGQYQFPFIKGSFMGNAVMDETVTFQDYISIEENWFAQSYLGQKHKYTSKQMESNWNCILIQRKTLLAAFMVADGKIIGINQGLRMFNIL